MTVLEPRRLCGWCDRELGPTLRRDAIYCSTRCRQAAHRTVVRRVSIERTDRPLRLAIADPPYMGLAKRYYGDQPTYAGEVDHAALLSRLATYDGWALACSSRSVPTILALAVAQGLSVRLAIWHRRRAPHPTARLVTAYEGVVFVPARSVAGGSTERITDVLIGVDAPRRPTLPGSVIGMKPPRWSAWVFQLLGATAGDTLDDLYPGSGMVSRAWASWTAAVDASPDVARDAS